MTTEQHTKPNASNATPGLIGVSFLLSIALLTYAVRMYTRTRPVFKLATPDYLVTVALVCELTVMSLLLRAIKLGASGYDEYISSTTRITIAKLFFAISPLAFWASSLSRISIGSMLLNFPVSKAWRITLWVLIVIQVIMGIGADVSELLQCRPIRANWAPVPNSVCWSAEGSQIYAYIYAGFGIVCDIIFACMPAYMFSLLNRPFLERMLGILLMSLGLIAALAGAMVLYHINAWNPVKAQFRDWIPVLWWYRVEEIGLVIASCGPFLKPLITHAMQAFGASPFKFRTISLPTVQEGEGGVQSISGEMGLTSGNSGGSKD